MSAPNTNGCGCVLCDRSRRMRETPLDGPKLDKVPEFTIETSYVAGDPFISSPAPSDDGNSNLFSSGWKYVLRWHDGKKLRVKYRYGFDSEANALAAAKARADREARALTPVRTVTYTPKV